MGPLERRVSIDDVVAYSGVLEEDEDNHPSMELQGDVDEVGFVFLWLISFLLDLEDEEALEDDSYEESAFKSFWEVKEVDLGRPDKSPHRDLLETFKSVPS